jgi:hypothetical protein
MKKKKVFKSSLSNKYLIFKYGIEKYLIKNLEIFVPASAGDYRMIGKETLNVANQVFPLIRIIGEKNNETSNIKKIEDFSKERKISKNAIALKNLFNKFKSDKSQNHNYHLIYSALFKNKDKVKNVLEIGIGTNNLDVMSNMGKKGTPGASLRAFKDFFKFASVYGADFDKRILFKEKRINTFYVDQTKIKTLSSLFSKINKKFDLIIDDGLHAIHANLNTTIISLKHLKKGGWLVIEDIPLVALDVWVVISKLLSKKYVTHIIKSKTKKNTNFLFLINRK